MKQSPLFPALMARGASMEVQGDWMVVEHFGGVQAELAALRAGAGLVDLAHTTMITLSGPNTRRWAHGMFTNHIKGLQPGQGNRSCMCDPKGRVQGLIDLYCVDEEHFFGVLEGVGLPWFEERYQMFLVLDDVEWEEEAEQMSLLSLQGPGAADILATLGLPVPEADHAHAEAGRSGDQPGIRVMRKDRTGLGGFDLAVPRSALLPTWEAALGAGAAPVGLAAVDALRIRAGRAAWPTDGGELTMVHELRYNEDCCSFTKGCYVGQEIINRIDVKGQVTKRLTPLLLAEDALPPAGAQVLLEGQAVGHLTSAARIDGGVRAVAVLRKAAWAPGTTVEIQAEGRTVAAAVTE